jgi:hypothetical protein
MNAAVATDWAQASRDLGIAVAATLITRGAY